MRQLGIAGVWEHVPVLHGDDRGSLTEWFRGAEFGADVGRSFDLAQANVSVSRRGVIRGIHFADVPPGQAKYVMCVRGAVLDVAVDLRIGSPTFGQWDGVRLDDETRRCIFLAEGLGHAFCALSEGATVVYLCSEPYAPGREHAVNPMDPEIGIAWPTGVELVLSEKDEAAPSLAAARASGLLPSYDDCIAYEAKRQIRPG